MNIKILACGLIFCALNLTYMLPQKPNPVQHRLELLRREAEERDAERRATRTGQAYANLHKAPVSLEAVTLVPEEEARAAKLAVIERKANELAVAAYNPQDSAVQKVVRDLAAKKYRSRLFVASMSGLEQIWQLYKYVSHGGKEITGEVEIEKKHFEELLGKLTNIGDVSKELDRVGRTTTTELLEVLLAGALNSQASDIHFEAEEKGTRVRFRLDGVLHDVLESLPTKNYVSLTTRIKLLAGLKINVHGEPQDGRFTIELPAKEVEVRVSIIPSEFGETIVMRLLDPETIRVDLSQLGLRADDLVLVENVLRQPNGLILNTGPTGSGKTTTLYAFLRKLNNPEIKIITIEDPIEYRIEGVEQTQTDPEVGYTFAGGLRAILRQDPDVILVGEIRDKETADIAMQASLTGHLVLSTLHTNDSIGAVPRLIDLGIKPQTIGPALSLVIAQRLMRKLCPKCKRPVKISAETEKRIAAFLKRMPARLDTQPYASVSMYEAVGCEACNSFGYKGRVGIFEFLVAGPELEELVLKDASEPALWAFARKQGMITLQEDGILKTLTGITSLEEVEKVTGPIAWELK